MDVSFIIPALNEEKLIEKCLKSIANQKTNLKFEIIVSDGKSKDKTVEIAKKYAKVIVCKRKGIAQARNKGAKSAKGELLIFIDADTFLPRDYLQKVWDHLKQNNDVVALTARIRFLFKKSFFKIAYNFLEVFLKTSSIIGHARLTGINIAVWKKHFKKVKGFPEVPSEDVFFTKRLLKLGKTEYYVGTYVSTSPRRFEGKTGFVKYYLLRDFLSSIQTSKLKDKKIVKKIEEKIEPKIDYKEIR